MKLFLTCPFATASARWTVVSSESRDASDARVERARDVRDASLHRPLRALLPRVLTMGVPSFNRYDERTHVGRQNMEFEQHNMYRRIHGATSSVDTHLVRQTRPKSAGIVAERAEMDAFREVREAARRINNLSSRKKGLTFTSPPKSMELGKRLSENRRAHRAVDPTAAYHAKQIANMQRRIADLGTLTERKKNVHNPHVNPVVIRKPAGRPPPWGFGSGHLSSAAAATRSRPSTARTLRPTADTTTITTPRRPVSARSPGGLAPGGGGRPRPVPAPVLVKGAEHSRPTTRAAKDHPAYQTLRKKLLHEIVRRDASEEDMAQIFAEAEREQSGSQHKHVLRRVIEDLRVELELEGEA